MKTDQEIFDITATHLLSQNEKSIIKSPDTEHGITPACRYRGEGGLKCAIGPLIPDDLYSANMEGLSIHRLFGRFPTLMEKCGLNICNQSLLIELQNIHDDYKVEEWRVLLWRLATANRLDPKVTVSELEES